MIIDGMMMMKLRRRGLAVRSADLFVGDGDGAAALARTAPLLSSSRQYCALRGQGKEAHLDDGTAGNSGGKKYMSASHTCIASGALPCSGEALANAYPSDPSAIA